MSTVLFVTRKENKNPVIDVKLKQKIDCEFVAADSRQIISAVENNGIKLIVLFLTKLTVQDEIEINTYLQNSDNTPIILAGDKSELAKYQNITKARVIRYIVTPMLLSEFINEINVCLEEYDGNKLEYLEIVEEKDLIEVKPKHILVVDDDPVMLRTISNWLNDLFIVSVAKSGTGALQYLSREKPDLILLDYEMPVCDGIQTLKMIRAEEDLKDIPVFFLTAVDDIELVKKALELKPQGYILKSKGSDHLISRIESYF